MVPNLTPDPEVLTEHDGLPMVGASSAHSRTPELLTLSGSPRHPEEESVGRLVEKALLAARSDDDEVARLLDDASDHTGLGALTRRSLIAFVGSLVGGVAPESEESGSVIA